MKRRWILVTAVACVAVLGVFAWSGGVPRSMRFWSGPTPVWSVTGDTGLRADITSYPVTVDGETGEGRKLLQVMGEAVFMNHMQVYPAAGTCDCRDTNDWNGYQENVRKEVCLVYGHLLDPGLVGGAAGWVERLVSGTGSAQADPDEAREAMAEVMNFLDGLTGVESIARAESEVEGGTVITVHYGEDPEKPYKIEISPDFADNYRNSWVSEERREEAEKHFYRIIDALEDGRRLIVTTGQQYRLAES